MTTIVPTMNPLPPKIKKKLMLFNLGNKKDSCLLAKIQKWNLFTTSESIHQENNFIRTDQKTPEYFRNPKTYKYVRCLKIWTEIKGKHYKFLKFSRLLSRVSIKKTDKIKNIYFKNILRGVLSLNIKQIYRCDWNDRQHSMKFLKFFRKLKSLFADVKKEKIYGCLKNPCPSIPLTDEINKFTKRTVSLQRISISCGECQTKQILGSELSLNNIHQKIFQAKFCLGDHLIELSDEETSILAYVFTQTFEVDFCRPSTHSYSREAEYFDDIFYSYLFCVDLSNTRIEDRLETSIPNQTREIQTPCCELHHENQNKDYNDGDTILCYSDVDTIGKTEAEIDGIIEDIRLSYIAKLNLSIFSNLQELKLKISTKIPVHSTIHQQFQELKKLDSIELNFEEKPQKSYYFLAALADIPNLSKFSIKTPFLDRREWETFIGFLEERTGLGKIKIQINHLKSDKNNFTIESWYLNKAIRALGAHKNLKSLKIETKFIPIQAISNSLCEISAQVELKSFSLYAFCYDLADNQGGIDDFLKFLKNTAKNLEKLKIDFPFIVDPVHARTLILSISQLTELKILKVNFDNSFYHTRHYSPILYINYEESKESILKKHELFQNFHKEKKIKPLLNLKKLEKFHFNFNQNSKFYKEPDFDIAMKKYPDEFKKQLKIYSKFMHTIRSLSKQMPIFGEIKVSIPSYIYNQDEIFGICKDLAGNVNIVPQY